MRAFQRVGVDTTSDGAAVADLHDPRESLHRELGSRAARGRRCAAALQVGRCKARASDPVPRSFVADRTHHQGGHERDASRAILPEEGPRHGGPLGWGERWAAQMGGTNEMSAKKVGLNTTSLSRTTPARQRARRSLHARRQAIAEGPSPSEPSSLGSSLLRRPVPARPFQLVTRRAKPAHPKTARTMAGARKLQGELFDVDAVRPFVAMRTTAMRGGYAGAPALSRARA